MNAISSWNGLVFVLLWQVYLKLRLNTVRICLNILHGIRENIQKEYAMQGKVQRDNVIRYSYYYEFSVGHYARAKGF